MRHMNQPIDQTPTNAQQTLDGLKWPRTTTDVRAQISLADLLIALQFLGTDAERVGAVQPGRKWDSDTPGSLQVLKSGVTGATKWWTKRAGAIGGATGVLAAVGGVVIGAIEPFRNALGEPLVVALIGGGALILAATLLSLAHFVNGDLMARAQATAARSAARAEVAATYLRTTAPDRRRRRGRRRRRSAPGADRGVRFVRSRARAGQGRLDVARGDRDPARCGGLPRFRCRTATGSR